MKIAIISGHFMPEVGYQEVYLARAFSRLGHQVRVITTNKPSPSARNIRKSDYLTGLTGDIKYNYSVLRLRATIKLGASIISLGLKKVLKEFSPDLVVLVAVGKFFPYPILDEQEKRNYKLVALFGDNSDFLHLSSNSSDWRRLKSILLQKVLKNKINAKAVKSCDRLYLNTPETEAILLSYLPKRLKNILKNKRVLSTLGFDPDEFHFDASDRNNVRRKLNIQLDEVVFITSTRVTRRKTIEDIIDLISKMYSEGKKVRYIIIGFLGDNYEMELKAYISTQPNPGIFDCYPFLSHEEIRQFYCAGDIGIWLQAAISIQESMGTGLPIILENKPVVKHLIQDGVNGWYFEQGELQQKLKYVISEIADKDAKSRTEDRKRIAMINAKKLSYDCIAQKMVKGTWKHVRG